jgi:hypothetical protein
MLNQEIPLYSGVVEVDGIILFPQLLGVATTYVRCGCGHVAGIEIQDMKQKSCVACGYTLTEEHGTVSSTKEEFKEARR